MNLIIKNIGQLVTVSANGKPSKAGKEMNELNVIEDAAIIVEEGIIKRVAVKSELPIGPDVEVLDAGNRVALPGFVDSHTHVVFAENPQDDVHGGTIKESNQGLSPTAEFLLLMQATRIAPKKELIRSANRRLNEMMRHGTTTVEIKSGYGLTVDGEIKMLDVINDLRRDHYMSIVPTFLGAYAFPPEFEKDHLGYVDLINKRMLPYIGERHLATFCDVSCDEGGFDLHQSENILLEAKQHGLIPKIHADRNAAIGASKLGAQLHCISVDHLNYLTPNGLNALKNSSAIATVLPGSSFFHNRQYAPARSIIDAGIPLSIATGFSPISSMCFSMQMMMSIACTQMKMTPKEAISASTINGAAALGLSDEIGSIEVGKQADIVLFDASNYTSILDQYGINHVWKVIKNGVILEF